MFSVLSVATSLTAAGIEMQLARFLDRPKPSLQRLVEIIVSSILQDINCE